MCSLCAHAEVLINFDVFEDGTPIPTMTEVGALPSFFGLKFSEGLFAITSGPFNSITITLTPHSPPNVAFDGVFTPVTASSVTMTAGVNPFALVQLYLSYVSSPDLIYTPGARISFTGMLSGNPVAGCNYAHTFTDPVPTSPGSLPWVLITTPGCTAVDEIVIDDSTAQYNFILDDITVIVPTA